jgi:sortase A
MHRIIRPVILALCLTCIFTTLALANEPAVVPQTTPIRLIIPTIALDSTIIPVGYKLIKVEGETYGIWETADNEVGWHNLSALLGQIGNTVLAGHSDIKARVFRDLKDVEIGDEIVAFAGNSEKAFRYVVTEKFLVQEKGVPLETRVKNAQLIAPTDDERLTLITCAYPGATHRLIVIARPLIGQE